jgi:FAD:protein FMN transferase
MQELSFTAMASTCQIQLDIADNQDTQTIFDQVQAEVLRIQNKYSRYRPDSVVSQINAQAGQTPYECDAETAALIAFAHRLHAQYQGVFDLTTGVLRQAWNFPSQTLPSPQAIAQLLPLVGWHQVQWSGRQILLPRSGMEIDLGGLGKEYAVDRVAHLLTQAGYHSALINFGGDVYATGPKRDASPWQVGIRHPRQDGLIAVIPLARGGLATSGDYERYMQVNGQRYAHLLHPATGWPVNHWQSISVLAPTCMLAGALSTTFMLLQEQATAHLKSCGLRSLCVTAQSKALAFQGNEDQGCSP